jgi:hypothetical protein
MKLEFMKIKEYSSIDGLECPLNSLFFYGEKIDDRSKEMVNFFTSSCQSCLEILYINKTNSFSVNGSNIKFNAFAITILDKIKQHDIKYILLESTSLGYTELLIILLYISKVNIENIEITILYAEPLEYTKNMKDTLDSDNYELSEDYHPHKYIKPFLLNIPQDNTSLEVATLVSFIGFEENRLGRVLDKNIYDRNYNEFIYIMPVPGFKFGWENISLSKHYHLMDNYKEMHYAPADDPYETYRILEKIVENNPSKKIVIMPLGTKPCTIGASIFLVNKKIENKYDIATKFDFPIKSKNRSKGISKIYEYKLKLV